MLRSAFATALAICGCVSAPLRAEQPCEVARLVEPATPVIADVRPRIAWEPVAGAESYVVWVESRVPEGRVLVSDEIRTADAFWVPPVPLTRNTAVVKVRVHANCVGSGSDATARTASAAWRFRIDAASACALPISPTVNEDHASKVLQWEAVPGARAYEIVSYSAIDGRVVSTAESLATRAALALPRGVWVVGVRAKCTLVDGALRYVTMVGD